MGRVIIACRTLQRELNHVMKKLNCSDPVIWLEAGGHNVAEKRREEISHALSQCEEYDTVILAMSFCGSCLLGLNSGNHTLLLPCFDDCISLFLVEPRRSDTYYLTDGWLDGERNIVAEYHSTLEKYGEARTNRIFSAMLRNYRYLAYLDTGCGTDEGLEKVCSAAKLLNLEFVVVPGARDRLEALLTEKSDSEILRIQPRTTITLEMRKGGISHA